MREIMTHRHLYAHCSGLVDNKYMENLIEITGIDIRGRVAALGYPEQEVYWFEPLGRLAQFIESARRFFSALP